MATLINMESSFDLQKNTWNELTQAGETVVSVVSSGYLILQAVAYDKFENWPFFEVAKSIFACVDCPIEQFNEMFCPLSYDFL